MASSANSSSSTTTSFTTSAMVAHGVNPSLLLLSNMVLEYEILGSILVSSTLPPI